MKPSSPMHMDFGMILFFISCTEPSMEAPIPKASSDSSPTPMTFASSRVIGPLIETQWGQGGVWQQSTPTKEGEETYPGCTTVATAQILYYYQHQNYANNDTCYRLDHALESADIEGYTLCVDFEADNIQYNWDNFATTDRDNTAAITYTADFLYHVGVTLNAQFGGGQGASATGRQIENSFRYQWGYSKRREDGARSKSVSIVLRDQFFPDEADFSAHLQMELRAGRPVLYMAQQQGANVGHAFIIDGYDPSSDLFHVNWGWGGRSDGYYDLSFTDPTGRSWSRNALIYQYLEPVQDAGLRNQPTQEELVPEYSWNGNGSLISYASGTQTGYGLTQDEAVIHPDSTQNPVVFFQWEVDTRDGKNIVFDAQDQSHATITYGLWNQRDNDVTHRNVPLPFILDPSQDGFDVHDQEYFVFAVRFDQKPSESTIVSARLTDTQGHSGVRVHTDPFLVDGRIWNGNASIISHTSGSQTGYGLDRDEGVLHPSQDLSVAFAQWEVSQEDGNKLIVSGPQGSSDIRYGFWDDRSQDIIHQNISFPYTIDPAQDGLNVQDGSYLVISVERNESSTQIESLSFTPTK